MKNKFNNLKSIMHRISQYSGNSELCKNVKPGVPKECVFCGSRPESKTKEHVLPKWLIEYTGDKKREIDLHVSTSLWEQKKQTLAFDNLVFPACEECNNSFSVMEQEVQKIFYNLSDGLKINNDEAEILLDWFDKIRVGMWLGGLMWSSNWMGIAPNYRIVKRNGLTDRIIYIGCSQEKASGLNFSNITDPIFMGNPQFFLMRVNNHSFLSLSGVGIAGGAMGLPRLKTVKCEGVDYHCEIKKPKNEKYTENWPATANSFSVLSQAMYGDSLLDEKENGELFWDNIFDKKKSKVGLMKDGQFKFLSQEKECVLSDKFESFHQMLQKSTQLFDRLRTYTTKKIPNSPDRYARLWTSFYKEYANIS